MLKKLFCWLLGHKTVVKAYTGEKIEANGNESLLYEWERSRYCVRCGVEVWKNEQ